MAAIYQTYEHWLSDHNVPIDAEKWGRSCWNAATKNVVEKFTSTNSAMVAICPAFRQGAVCAWTDFEMHCDGVPCANMRDKQHQ